MERKLTIGRYALQLHPLKLMEGRRHVPLSRLQLKVLALIVEAGGATVTKKVLLDQVWNGSFVEDGNLTQTIFMIRKTLGKLPDGGEFIETMPRVGYRLSPTVRSRKASKGKLTAQQADALSSKPMPEEHQFRLLVESIEDYAIYMLDIAGRVVTWNAGAAKSKGYSSEEVLGQHYAMFFVPEDIDQRVPDRELTVAGRAGRCVGEGWRIRKNGERYWASFVITAIRSPRGTLLGYSKVVRDLTERKRQEDAMLRMEALVRRDRDRLNAAAESSMDAIYLCEAVRDKAGDIEDFVFTYVNSNAEKMVAMPRERLLGAKVGELLPINRTSGLFEEYKRVVLTGEPYRAECFLRSDSVTSEWLRVQAVRAGDGVAVTAADIGELHRRQWRSGRSDNAAARSSQISGRWGAAEMLKKVVEATGLDVYFSLVPRSHQSDALSICFAGPDVELMNANQCELLKALGHLIDEIYGVPSTVCACVL